MSKEDMKMKFIAIFFLTVMIICFYGCNTKNSKPYSAKKTASILSDYYGVEIELVKEEKIKSSPYAINRYWFKDKKLGFEFYADAGFSTTVINVVLREINDNYQTALMLHYQPQTIEIAKKYNLRYVSVDSLKQNPNDYVYISSENEIENVTKFYFELQKLYNFNFSDRQRPLNTITTEPQILLWYLPENQSYFKKDGYCIAFHNYGFYGKSKLKQTEQYTRLFTNFETLNNLFLIRWKECAGARAKVDERMQHTR